MLNQNCVMTQHHPLGKKEENIMARSAATIINVNF